MRTKYLIFIILVLLISGCGPNQYHPIKWKHPIKIPNADIVFSTITEPRDKELFGDDILGFYTFADESTEFLDLGSGYSPVRPYYLDAETLIAVNKLGYYGEINETRSDLLILWQNIHQRCFQFVGDAFPNNGNIIFFGEDITVVNEYDCSTVRTIFTEEDLYSFGEFYQIGLQALAQDESFIVFDVAHDLIKVTLPQKEVFDYQREGEIPSISPDQKKIAYIAPDGIHIMDTTGENDFLAVPYRSSSYEGEEYDVWSRGTPPRPNWSKDSSKIVYHKCILHVNYYCSYINNYNIFVYDLKTKEETMIITSGLNPSWNYYN